MHLTGRWLMPSGANFTFKYKLYLLVVYRAENFWWTIQNKNIKTVILQALFLAEIYRRNTFKYQRTNDRMESNAERFPLIISLVNR